MNTHFKAWALSVAVLAGAAAHADSISTLYSTGVDANGNAQGNGAAELHYTLTPGQPSAFQNNQNLIVQTQGYPVEGSSSIYVAPDPSYGPGEWIGPDNENLDDDSGTYDYQTSFSLAGLDPTTAQIYGTMSADDDITACT